MSEYVGTIKGILLMELYRIELKLENEGLVPTPDAVKIARNRRILTTQMTEHFTRAINEYAKGIMVELEKEGLVYSVFGFPVINVPPIYQNKKLTEKGKAVVSVLKKAIDEINIMLK